ncbi:MAG: hypothetical protein AVDCRST_MAG59-3814 [uncultured Thermomicrobiales bacterium]|uniref:Uncharacterized protein n=1 Tax=uncultured Thermomicrobiales bacterium TaxID=1645740 RepID=A0A6J4VAX8_9BACT|nr:MAG: hypothetical protein AVDCRST_MAG59-3814 [uncultured Thermomicrobiales bacterium]
MVRLPLPYRTARPGKISRIPRGRFGAMPPRHLAAGAMAGGRRCAEAGGVGIALERERWAGPDATARVSRAE